MQECYTYTLPLMHENINITSKAGALQYQYCTGPTLPFVQEHYIIRNAGGSTTLPVMQDDYIRTDYQKQKSSTINYENCRNMYSITSFPTNYKGRNGQENTHFADLSYSRCERFIQRSSYPTEQTHWAENSKVSFELIPCPIKKQQVCLHSRSAWTYKYHFLLF